ncbi:rCG35475 [Rattus norvegicus]|uniref:RCG35475 n=1 Tax=Rattus norvegicus TaxID=10116 RepID=A6HKI3_RAT|nr:rCG35475 [Rattus norvegicus]
MVLSAASTCSGTCNHDIPLRGPWADSPVREHLESFPMQIEHR